MGSLATEVSLHCMICYEEFNIRDRAPVVLPCGHTYICEVCAKRLTKCMECREPLFWTPPATSKAALPPVLNMNSARSPQALRFSGTANRNRYTPGPQTPPHPSYTGSGAVATPAKEEPIPLPLPRNAVLMEMIEAAERQARLLSELKKQQQTSEEDDALIEPTLAGMSALAGACGTYAVKEPLGLAVLPFDPNLRHDGRKDGEEKKTEEAREPFTIEDGQMVQVVAEDDGVYQLARGVGYIVASVNQLVKVGGPLEKSCRLEGMLDSVLQKRMQLQKQVDELTLLANGLREQIKIEDDKPEEHPVISARKERPQINDENDDEVEKQHPATPPKQPTVLQSPPSTDSTEVEVGIHQTPVLMAQRHIYENSPARSCPMPMRDHNSVTEDHLQQPFMDEQSAGLPRYRISNDDNELGITGSLFGCGSALFGERLLELDGNSRNLLEGMNSMVLSFDDEEATLGGRSHNTARTTDDSTYRSMPTRTGSFDGGAGVNFRTGMSGHRGLTQVKKKASPSSHSRREIRMMSDHRGVGHVRGSQKPENHVHPRTYMP